MLYIMFDDDLSANFLITPRMLGYKMTAFKFGLQHIEISDCIFQESKVLDANRLELRSGPTYVGPDLGSNLFAS